MAHPFLQRNWSAFYAPGQEIRDYLDSVVDQYKLRPYIKLHHRVTRAAYNEAAGKWQLTIRRPKNEASITGTYWDWKTNFEEFEDTADVLFGGFGGLSRWSWPDIEGLENFKGMVIHSAQWETGKGKGEADGPEWAESVQDWGDKRVGVIGVVRIADNTVVIVSD
jgi:cation diffusion facilitator CzcD-associated flavoprotein CzcO